VYRRQFALVAEAALRQRRNNIVPLFAGVTTRKITEVEMQELAFDPRMFDNLNTPEEWDQACRRTHK
jgi:molybdopterin-guanine dinucleotide biosynthesis protein A